MSDTTLTGRKRYRTQKIGPFWNRSEVLVLQWEFSGLRTRYMSGVVETEHATWWLDAKPEWETTHDA